MRTMVKIRLRRDWPKWRLCSVWSTDTGKRAGFIVGKLYVRYRKLPVPYTEVIPETATNETWIQLTLENPFHIGDHKQSGLVQHLLKAHNDAWR